MLEWTGERFLPWLENAAIAYEHLHRYLFARQMVKGRRVLDLATGEGYGANLLAGTALMVTGLDIDYSATHHARSKYRKTNLEFVAASVTSLPFVDRSFDVVTCFEVIEHIEDHPALLSEVKRVLDENGLFIVSTPNKTAYRAAEQSNPFHVKELSAEEFEALLKSRFANVESLGQRIHPTSTMWHLKNGGSSGEVREFLVERGESEFQMATGANRVPIYVMALAADGPIPIRDSSVLVDVSDRLIAEKDTLIADLLAGKDSDQTALRWLGEKVQDRDAALAGLEKALKWKSEQNDELQHSMVALNEAVARQRSTIEEQTRTIDVRQSTVEEQRQTIDELHRVLREREEVLAQTTARVESLENASRELTAKLQPAPNTARGNFLQRWCPEGSLRRRLFSRLF
jgi:O-antigen biosynthesis protein